MGNLTGIFDRLPRPPAIPVHDQIESAMIAAGLEPPEQIHIDGHIHRFNSGTTGKRGASNKPGWYVFYDGEIVAGSFGCWRADIEQNFRQDIGRELSPIESMAHTSRIAAAKQAKEAERKKHTECATESAQKIWDSCQPASDNHPYLLDKKVSANGARVTGDGRLVVPAYDIEGNLKTLQYISADGSKLFHSGAVAKSAFWQIGSAVNSSKIFLAEGFSTSATIHQLTNNLNDNYACIIAYSASNIPNVADAIKQIYPDKKIVIVADNDESGTGKKYADIAAKNTGATVVMPPIHGDANDYYNNGHDLLALLNPPKTNWLVAASDFCSQPEPIRWLIKGWIQRNALIMVHGPSGGGKSFCVLDWCLRIASQKATWMNKKIHGGPVVYLAGEGHHGLKGRVAAWIQHNQPSNPVNMWLSKSGCDLNTEEGYNQVEEQISELPEPPALIVVDTLHRFLNGDENSAQDAKTMLDACGGLMERFGCSVLLVHHTGVSDESQHRARGSSAWRGALDIEISVKPTDHGMNLIQRKSKDSEQSEPVNLELKSIPIDGWIDEDGEPVTSAVIVEGDATAQSTTKLDKKTQDQKQILIDMLLDIADIDGESITINASPANDWLVDQGYAASLSSARNMTAPRGKKMFANLHESKIIRQTKKGQWQVIDQDVIQQVVILRQKL
jgi:phage/plasmid primase-like uncharacterized protein/KaiC/GvpD/RAD55 family RecA-like ATPase